MPAFTATFDAALGGRAEKPETRETRKRRVATAIEAPLGR